MSQKLTDLSQAQLVRANRANLYEFFRHFAVSPKMDFAQADGLVRWSSPLQYAWFNAVLCERNVTWADEAFVDESLVYFKDRNTSEISWWLEDGVELEGWQDLLSSRGFELVPGPVGMSLDLTLLKEDYPLPHGLEIKVVVDLQGAQDFAAAMIEGYSFPLDWKSIIVDFYLGLGLESPFRNYVAYWDGQPVSTASVFFGREVAGIYSVATAPAARGKGIGTAITAAPLLLARQMGYRAATLQASKMGLSVYKRMGFEEDFRVGSFYYNLE
jgi:GNAT superfamily N-acetyltransferase